MDAPILDYYSRRAPEYDRIYAKPERQADLARLRQWIIDTFRDHDVLELACGPGYWTQVLANTARSVVATDNSPRVLELARGRRLPEDRVRFQAADAYQADAIQGSFSAVFAGFWWSHVPRAALNRFLAGIHRLGVAGSGQPPLIGFTDNRYVAGSSTPVSRRDDAGNTYQERSLDDGSRYEILKNFPNEAELTTAVEPFGTEIQIVELEYFWCLTYQGRGDA